MARYFALFVFSGFFLLSFGCPKHKVHPQAVRLQRLCVKYVMSNQLKLAQNAGEEALHYNPKFEEAMNCLGLVELMRNNLSGAERWFKKALSVNSNFAEARANLGHVYFLQKKFRRAAKLFKSALDIDPSHTNANYNLARTYIALREWKKAENRLLKMLLFPKNQRFVNAYNLLTYVYFELKDYRRAAAASIRALQLDPRNHIAHLNLCKTMFQLGRFQVACQHCQQAYEYSNGGIEAKKAIMVVDKVLRPHGKRCAVPN